MKDLNYFPLKVESNIYAMTALEFEDATSKVLLATQDCKIYCINYNKFKPHTKEVEFTYIPTGARIISIGALKRGPNDFVIGITHSLAPSIPKSSSKSVSSFQARDPVDYSRLTTYYFNIYATGSVSPNFDLDYVAQGCQTVRLRYVPYHLYQTEVISFTDAEEKILGRKPYWLLSGGDVAIHAFCEDKTNQSFTEVAIEDCFAELANVGGIALWIDVKNLTDKGTSCERAVALGLEDGSVRFYHSVLSETSNRFELVRASNFDEFTTITPSVRLFTVHSTRPSKLKDFLNEKGKLIEDRSKTFLQLNLLAVNSTNGSLVFEDVLSNGLDRSYELSESRRLDCSVTSAIADTNLDGRNEIIIGTHGQELMIYKFDKDVNKYYLTQVHELNHPIYAVSILDLTGDALMDVTILLASGILIMQAAVKDVIDICKRRVDAIWSVIK